MPKSTPISQIRKEQDNSELVQNILNEMENTPSNPQQNSQQNPQQNPQQQQYQIKPKYENEDEYEEFYDEDIIEQQRPMSTTDIITSEMKLPLLVVFLVFLTNFDMVNQLIMKNVPKLATGGELNVYGLVIKALLAGIVFYIVKRFLL